MSEANRQLWEVSKSGIHNLGLFATSDIPAGTRIIEYFGKKITKEESRKMAEEWESQARAKGDGLVYTFELNSEYDLDGNIENNPAKYANHHCEPNCESINEGETIWFVSSKDIKKGEEITFDYGYGMENFFDHRCRCGAASCPGYIVRKDLRWRLRHILASKLLKNKETKGDLQLSRVE
jgi:uncharacterized protein